MLLRDKYDHKQSEFGHPDLVATFHPTLLYSGCVNFPGGIEKNAVFNIPTSRKHIKFRRKAYRTVT